MPTKLHVGDARVFIVSVHCRRIVINPTRQETELGTRLQRQYEECIGTRQLQGKIDKQYHAHMSNCRNTFASIVVTHDRLHMGDGNSTIKRNAFHCARVGETNECSCKCNQHPTCCFKTNKVLGVSLDTAGAHAGINTAAIDNIAGNRFQSIQNQQECCDLCTNHPSCTGWVYDSDGVCLLKQGALSFVDNVASDQITTWAGRPSGISCAT